MTKLLLSGSDALLLGNDVVYVTVEGIVCVVVGTVVVIGTGSYWSGSQVYSAGQGAQVPMNLGPPGADLV